MAPPLMSPPTRFASIFSIAAGEENASGQNALPKSRRESFDLRLEPPEQSNPDPFVRGNTPRLYASLWARVLHRTNSALRHSTKGRSGCVPRRISASDVAISAALPPSVRSLRREH